MHPNPPFDLPLTDLPQQPCPYLKNRISGTRAIYAGHLPGEVYHDLMDAGFRRSGRMVYQPHCPDCNACRPIRVPVDQFTPSKSQRRCWRKNQDLSVNVSAPNPTDEKFDLYIRYLRDRHNASEEDRETFELFLYDSPVETIEFEYRDRDNNLLAVGLCDSCSRSLSSVYYYFDPRQEDRGLGNYGVMYEIEYARRQKIPWYYLGFWVEGCSAMEYKGNFRPYELLGPPQNNSASLKWRWMEQG